MAKHVYSFLDCVAGLVGPGGAINLAAGAGAAEEGITFEPADDTNVMQVGADGSGQHSLNANKSGTVTVRLLKTSPVNQQLAAMYAFQRASSDAHGRNTINLADTSRGDVVTALQVAFKRAPSLSFQKTAGFNEWTFDAISIDFALG